MNCILCLEITESYQNLIIVNSSEWQEQNIQCIIEKHLWKMEILNVHSYVCLACWQQLNSFHKFYSKVEKAHSNLKAAVNTEEFCKDIEKQNNANTDEILNNNKIECKVEPEILFLREENLLEIFEKEDEEEFSSLKRNTKSKCSKKKKNKKPVKINSSWNKSNEEKVNNETNKLKSEENPNDIDTKLQVEETENGAKENKMKFNKKKDEINFKLEIKPIDNDDNENTVEENFDDPNDSVENDMVDSSKLNQLPDEDDKFIAEHFQITCTLCQTPLATYALMLKHYRNEHKRRGYASCCSRKFYPRIELIDHIKLHQNPEYFKCKYCDKILTRRANLKCHIKKVHLQSNIECEICGKLLVKSSLKRHMTLHETDDDKKPPCRQCGKIFFSKPALKNHIKVVHKKSNYQICDLCGKSIPKSSFERHMCEHEGKPPPTVSCEICGRHLSDMPCLKRHMRLNHPPKGVTPEFKCTECKKIYTSHSSLKSHIRTVHESKYTRKCTLCGKSFKGPAPLKEHMSRHVGQPLRACTFCPKVFYSNGNMYSHRKREHPIEWEKSIREKYYRNLPEKDDTKAMENQ